MRTGQHELFRGRAFPVSPALGFTSEHSAVEKRRGSCELMIGPSAVGVVHPSPSPAINHPSLKTARGRVVRFSVRPPNDRRPRNPFLRSTATWRNTFEPELCFRRSCMRSQLLFYSGAATRRPRCSRNNGIPSMHICSNTRFSLFFPSTSLSVSFLFEKRKSESTCSFHITCPCAPLETLNVSSSDTLKC